MILVKTHLLWKAQGLTNSLTKSNVSVPGSMNNELVRSCTGKLEGVKKNPYQLLFYSLDFCLGGAGGRKVEGYDL